MTWPWRRAAPGGERWLVVDVESSGLDPARDRLLSIAGVALHSGRRLRLQPGDSFEVVLRQPAPSGSAPDRDNILLHGIGVGAQRDGVAAADALRAFDDWTAGAPLLAFHAAFDRKLIEAASRREFGRAKRRRWADLAALAPALEPVPGLHALDDWLRHFGLPCLARHQAAADAWAAAELLQRLWPRLTADAAGVPGFGALRALAARRRWLGG